MKSVVDYFKELSKIPRCSGNRDKFIDFFRQKAKEFGYEINIDKEDNILCYFGNPKICLQAHYDMVCISKDEDFKLDIYEENGYLKSKNTTLGADNGIAIAYILKLMEQKKEIEILLTSDEEIGLIGASNLEHKIKSQYILNIDTEEEAIVYIGCAGGVDINASKEFHRVAKDNSLFAYQLSIFDLAGGHSGVDINKNIPNAIKVLINELQKYEDIKIVSIDGGDRSNSIPKNASAIFYANKELKEFEKENIRLVKVNIDSDYINDEVLPILNHINSGVLEFNAQLNCVESSQNFAIVKTINNKIEIVVSQRSMDNNKLHQIELKQKNSLMSEGFSCNCVDKYPAWKPKVDAFVIYVENEYKKFFNNVELRSVHAGLECSILVEKYPNVKMASIGPNIYLPHSISEKTEIHSINKVYEVVYSIIENIGRLK